MLAQELFRDKLKEVIHQNQIIVGDFEYLYTQHDMYLFGLYLQINEHITRDVVDKRIKNL